MDKDVSVTNTEEMNKYMMENDDEFKDKDT